MKDLTLSVVGVLAIALCLGLGFQWLYPNVELTDKLAGLFVFMAVVLKLVFSKVWALRQGVHTPADAGTGK